MSKKWVVEFTVADSWVADGFEMTNELALDMLSNVLGYAYEHELGAKVTRAPKQEAIDALQFGTVEAKD